MKKWLTGALMLGLIWTGPAVEAAEKRTISIVSFLPAADARKLERTVNLWNLNSTTKMVLTPSCLPNTQCAFIHLSQPSPGFTGEANPWEGWIKISPKAWSQYNRRLKRAILCHELGHILGLGHTNTGCMYEFGLSEWKPGLYNRSIVPGELLYHWVV